MKKQLFILILIFCSITANAHAQQETGLASFWSLKYSIKYGSQNIRSFDSLVSATNGAGYFIWTKTKTNVSIPDIPGIQIKPKGSIYGYWRRAFSGPIQVDWFGANNTTTQRTWAEYGYSQSKLDSIFGCFGNSFVLTSDFPDGTAIRCAFKLMQTPGYQSVQFSPNLYYIDRACNLPRRIATQSTPFKYIIDGNASQIKGRTGYTGDYFVTLTSNQTEADDSLIDRHFVIRDFKFIGSAGSGSGQHALYLTSINKSRLSDLEFGSLDIAIELRFALSTTIENPNIINSFTYGILADTGTWTGADFTNSQCNVLRIVSPRLFCTSTFAGIQCVAASNISIYDPTLEGPNTSTAKWGINFLTGRSTLVKGVYIYNLYGEVSFDSAAIHINGGSGNYVIDRVYFRKTTNVIFGESVGPGTTYPQIEVRNIEYWEGASRFVQRNATPNNIYWDFYNCRVSSSFNTAANIINPANNFWNTSVPGSSLPVSNNVAVKKMVQY